jgi:hypothetical protein
MIYLPDPSKAFQSWIQTRAVEHFPYGREIDVVLNIYGPEVSRLYIRGYKIPHIDQQRPNKNETFYRMHYR